MILQLTLNIFPFWGKNLMVMLARMSILCYG